MPASTSILKKIIKELPDDFVMKKGSVKNYLMKRGVKPDELEFSGLAKQLDEGADATAKMSKGDLMQMEAQRQDIHSYTTLDKSQTQFNDVTVPGTDKNTYEENIRSFTNKGEDRKVSSHFDDYNDNYVWHTRTSQAKLGGVDTRVVQEVQSDLHQKGMTQGYGENNITVQNFKEQASKAESRYRELMDASQTRELTIAEQLELNTLGVEKDTFSTVARIKEEGLPANTPYKKNWSEKALEEELLRAQITGDKAIAVPISGPGTEELIRSEGVAKWYNEKVTSQLKKLAKKIGGQYKEVEVAQTPIVTKEEAKELTDFFVPAVKQDMVTHASSVEELAARYTNESKFRMAPSMRKLENFLYERGFNGADNLRLEEALTKAKTPEEYIKILIDNASSDRAVKYGQIVLPEDKGWVSKMTLYSAGGAEAALIAQSLEKGAQPQELKDFLVQEQGMNPDEANQTVDDILRLKLETSLKKGAPEDELIDFVSQQYGYDPEYLRTLLPEKKAKEGAEGIGHKSARELYVEKLKKIEADDTLTWREKFDAKSKAGVEFYGISSDPQEAMRNMLQGNNPRNQTPEEIYAKVSNIYTKYANMPHMITGTFGNYEDRAQMIQDLKDVNNFVVESLNKNGFDARVDELTGEVYLINPETGEEKLLEPSLWEEIKASKSEIASGIVMGIAAERALTGARSTPGPWWAKALVGIGAFTGTVLAGATGATLGRRQDILRNALETNQEISDKLLYDQMVDAGAADVVFSVAGTAFFKSVKGVVKGVYRAYDLMLQGNKAGAYQSLKQFMNLSDDQVDEIIAGWEKLNGKKAPGFTRAEKALHIIPRTEPGGEALVNPAAALDTRASTIAAQEIDNRAKDLLEQAKTISSDNMSTILRDELTNYKALVKNRYTAIKNYAVEEMQNSGFTFDYSDLAIDPILERTQSELTNPALRERALRYMERIRQLGGYQVTIKGTKEVAEQVPVERTFRRSGSKTVMQTVAKEVPTSETMIQPTLRTFEDLLELRRVVNEFGNSRLVRNAKDIEMLTQIRKRIDTQIVRAANENMSNADVWLKNWKQVNTEYSKMHDLEKNVLYRQIMAQGRTDKNVAKALMNRAMATDGTFREVTEKLPPHIRALTENSVMEQFIEKFTAGESGGMRAVNFPMLAEELKQVPFTTTKAQNLKRVITEMADVFKNDVNLARATGTIQIPRFQSYLTTDPIVRAKYMIASHSFNYIRRLAPTDAGNANALVHHVARVLENPSNAKNFDALLKALPDDPQLKNTLKAAQIEIAKFGEKSTYPHVTIYRRAPAGQSMRATDGNLGRGIYFKTTKEKMTSRGTRAVTRPEGKLTLKKVLPDRIANVDNIADVLGISPDEVTSKVIRSNAQLQEVLKNKGYVGLTLDDNVLIFK